ncbi:MAG: hypothetical protein WCZ02_08640, partial [Lysobacterales bacterium]
MIRSIQGAALVAALFSVPLAATAQDLLIRDARVHTAAAAGTLERADILVQGGVIRAVGPDLAAPAGIATVQAQGRPVTPGLFAGLTGLGVEEVSGEAETVDSNLSLSAPGQASDHQPTWRP